MMKITRVIDGVEHEFILTKDEIIQAYKEQILVMDETRVDDWIREQAQRMQFDDHFDEMFEKTYRISLSDITAHITEIASVMHGPNGRSVEDAVKYCFVPYKEWS